MPPLEPSTTTPGVVTDVVTSPIIPVGGSHSDDDYGNAAAADDDGDNDADGDDEGKDDGDYDDDHQSASVDVE